MTEGGVLQENPGVARTGPQTLFYALGCAALITVIAWFGRQIFIPLVVAGFLSFLIYTLKETIRRGPLVGRFMPNWLCYLFAFGLIVAVFTLLIDIVRDNVETLIEAAPLYEERLRSLSQEGIAWLEAAGVVPQDFIGGVEEMRRAALDAIRPILAQLGQGVRSLTGGFVTVLLYTIFMLLERRRIFKKIELLNAGDEQRRAVNDTIADIGALVRQYITVKTASNLITATVSYFIMLAVGVDFAGFWALMIFALNFIPIVGAVSAITLPVILLLIQPDGGAEKALLALVLLVAAEQTMSSGIEPRIIGRSVNLSPLAILLSLAVWGSLWGFAGLLLAVPLTVTIMIVLTQFAPTRPLAILLSDSGDIAPLKHAPVLRGV